MKTRTSIVSFFMIVALCCTGNNTMALSQFANYQYGVVEGSEWTQVLWYVHALQASGTTPPNHGTYAFAYPFYGHSWNSCYLYNYKYGLYTEELHSNKIQLPTPF